MEYVVSHIKYLIYGTAQYLYSLIAFNERVTFGFNVSGVHVRMLHYLHVNLMYNQYAMAHAYNAANTHTKGSDQVHVETKKLPSCRRQGYFSATNLSMLLKS